MNSTLEQKTKVHYHCLVEPRETGVEHQTETAIIKDAYFGRYDPLRPSPLGLNLGIKYPWGNASATYTNMRSIGRLMDDFKVTRVEELKGKKVVAHMKGTKLLGLSVPTHA